MHTCTSWNTFFLIYFLVAAMPTLRCSKLWWYASLHLWACMLLEMFSLPRSYLILCARWRLDNTWHKVVAWPVVHHSLRGALKKKCDGKWQDIVVPTHGNLIHARTKKKRNMLIKSVISFIYIMLLLHVHDMTRERVRTKVGRETVSRCPNIQRHSNPYNRCLQNHTKTLKNFILFQNPQNQ